MRVDIIFQTSSTPKVITDAVAVYTKGAGLMVELESGLITGYPLCNVFSWAYEHQPHRGSTKQAQRPGGE